MATGSGLIGSGGGAAGYNNNSNSHRGSSNSSRNRGTTAGSGRKKFGKNLNKVLSKTPAAPPVPVISTSSGSQSLFRGSSSSNNGLLLLSTKSKTSGGSGLLQPLGSASSLNNAPSTAASSPKTAHDALLLSAAGVTPGEEGGKKMASGPVWGREKQSASLEKQSGGEQEENKPAAALLVAKKAPAETVPIQQLGEDVQKLNLSKRDDADKPIAATTATEPKVSADTAEKPLAPKIAVIETKKQPQQKSNDDEMAVYMSKLAKQRAEKIQSEEEARTLQQKEAAALRLRELEDKKRLATESKKKQTPPSSPPPPPPSKQNPVARRDASKPSSNIVLEPLGKSKKNTVAPPKPKTPVMEKNKKLYDPERPYSSLVGGSNSNTKSNKKSDKQNSSKDGAKKEDKPVLVHLDSLDDHGRRNNAAESAGGPRMLFDPTSGSMVKASKKVKQQSPKVSDDTAEKLRHVDKSLRREKKGGGGRKDDYAASNTPNSSHANKDRKAQKQLAKQRIPRTCGVLFKVDTDGNYINVDRCEADNGYGAHLVPGGRIRNPTAHAQLLDEERLLHEQQAHAEGNLNAAAESFSFRNDPGFVQHQTEFEARQQKILEDAWASLVETEEQQHEETEEKPKAKSKSSVDDDYAAALAMSPSMIGLNFDQNDTSDSIMLPPSIKANAKPHNTAEPSVDFQSFGFADNDAATSNPFGGGLWGNTAGGNDLGALSGWDFTSTSSENQDSKPSTTSKLNLWGSGVLESPRNESPDKPSNDALG